MLSHQLVKNETVYQYIDKKVADTLDIDSRNLEQKEESAYIDKLPLPESIKNQINANNSFEVKSLLNVSNFSGYVSGYITCMILNAISYLLIVILVLIAVRILANLLDIISKLPVLNSINKIGGIAVGTLKGVIIVWLFFVVITVFSGSEFGKSMFEMINDSVVLSYLYNNNLLMDIVLSVAKSLF